MARVIDVHERPPLKHAVPLGIQHLFAMFGATVLVPFLTGLNPSVALLSSGLGTLLFIVITKGQVPAYLGSSFAFIAPIQLIAAQYGFEYALGGTVAVGLLYTLVALVVRAIGVNWIHRMLPPVVVGPVIIVIGLGLAATGVDMAGLAVGTDPETGATILPSLTDPAVWTAAVTLAVALFASIKFRGFLASIPILIAIVVGYLFALAVGMVDLEPVRQARWFALPDLTLPKFSVAALSIMLPVSLVTMAEHLGDVMVVSRVVGRDFFAKPGLHRTLMGDGLATSLAGLIGGPPNTTYGENVGVMAITKVFSVWVIGLAALFATGLAFIDKVGALIRSIPSPVMGGISMMLFGVIAASGLRTLIENQVDLGKTRNLLIASVILVLGVGNATLNLGGSITLSGMALATLVGIVLNLILPEAAADRQEQAE